MQLVHFFKPSSEYIAQVNSLFEQHKQQILQALVYAQVEHIGATSVPNALTKGDLDLLVRVEEEQFVLTVEQLKSLYDIHQLENWTSCFASFKEEKNSVIPLGVQVVIAGSQVDYFAQLRDLLIDQPELLIQIDKLKSSFEGKDMESYIKAKGEFYERVLGCF